MFLFLRQNIWSNWLVERKGFFVSIPSDDLTHGSLAPLLGLIWLPHGKQQAKKEDKKGPVMHLTPVTYDFPSDLT